MIALTLPGAVNFLSHMWLRLMYPERRMSDFSFFIIILWRHEGILIEQVTFTMYVFRMFLRLNKPDCALWLAAPASAATILYNLYR